ncbi:hypothetical protein PoB_000346700 [Plakobranchus ocellatus]|uniref:Uncharacterized protein n=1 Tax=Plakobranchus ocellatus TaxID=259542 RepID=A0AAV3Y3E3_9GAST|nr:hypothetical protein PoB_000346700 [Plakobranchus ocellatus]
MHLFNSCSFQSDTQVKDRCRVARAGQLSEFTAACQRKINSLVPSRFCFVLIAGNKVIYGISSLCPEGFFIKSILYGYAFKKCDDDGDHDDDDDANDDSDDIDDYWCQPYEKIGDKNDCNDNDFDEDDDNDDAAAAAAAADDDDDDDNDVMMSTMTMKMM